MPAPRPLLVASENDHAHVVELLRDAGATKDIAMDGGTPFYIASQDGHAEVF